MTQRRVVITGLGAISSLGLDKEELWTGLLAGRSGIRLIDRFDVEEHPCKIAAFVQGFEPHRWLEHKEVRHLDIFSQLTIAAGDMAVADSGIDWKQCDTSRCGVILGTGIGGLHTIEEQHKILMERGAKKISPFLIPKLMANAISGHISIRYGLFGVNFVTASACASAAHAIGLGLQMIQSGAQDIVVSGGGESAITPLGLAGFCNMRALSRRNESPETASRPFDKDRDGFVMGEGAGLLILEELEHAKKRNAHIYCELCGVGWTADAHHITAPSEKGIGATVSMSQALEQAKINKDQVSYINAHGTSTPLNDQTEVQAIVNCFGEALATRIPISSSKSMIGHLLGASGGVEAVITALSIDRNTIHATANFQESDFALPFDFVPKAPRELPVHYALSNSFGFGGHNVSLLMGKLK
jgi:3-oxoacyl-[acyl-carrier-protein] synthase II